jgi:hypothetical protein
MSMRTRVRYGLGSLRRAASLCIVIVWLSSTAEATHQRDPVLTRMAKVDVFAFGGIGFAGAISPGEKDYRLISSRPSAIADFERVFAVGTREAKCYALTGLFRLDRKRFNVLSSGLRNSKAQVDTMHGCMGFPQTFQAVIEAIEAGEYGN